MGEHGTAKGEEIHPTGVSREGVPSSSSTQSARGQSPTVNPTSSVPSPLALATIRVECVECPASTLLGSIFEVCTCAALALG